MQMDTLKISESIHAIYISPDIFYEYRSCLLYTSCFEKAISQAQMIMFPGGFSAGDEPDGSAKFFATAFQNEKIKEAVMDLLNKRDGLALGICNGCLLYTSRCV